MRTITNVFLLNLAISDILLGVLCMPVTLVGTLLRNFIFGEFFCKLIQFSQAASVAVSSWTLVAISCERYYAICHPLRSRRWQTRSHAYKIIACIWFGSMLCMTPIALFSQLMTTSRQGYHKCRENWPGYALPYERPYNLFLDLILLVLPLVILSVAYILITRTLYVGMRIEKAMIFGAGSCNGKFNSEDMYTTFQSKCPTSMSSGGWGNGAYLSTTSSSSMTTLASATTASSSSTRFKFHLSLRRHGRQTTTKQKNDNVTRGAACSNGGGGMGVMRASYGHNKGHLDSNIQETDMFNQQEQQQPPKPYHQSQHNNYQTHQQRSYQYHHQQQQHQNHCHNYHQHQLVLHHNDDQEHNHHHSLDKLCCANITRFCCGKRTPTSSSNGSGGSNNGRRHLYCMRFATLKSTLPDNDSINGTSSYCTSECCSSNISNAGNATTMGAGAHGGNNPAGNLAPSTSTSLVGATSSTTYRYQMQQQQQQPYNLQHQHPHNGRNYCMQQVSQEFNSKRDGKKLFSSNKRNLRSSDSVLRRNNIAKNLESKKRVVKMLSVLVLEFFICWTPLYVINTVAMYIGSAIYEYIDYKSISALQLLAYSSSCCNPITYCFMNANFRRAFLDTFKGIQWCGKWFRRKRPTPQNGNLCLVGGNSSIRVNSCTAQTVIDSPRL